VVHNNNMMKKTTDYDIRIGNSYNYKEYDVEDLLPVTVTNISFDGFYFVIEFKHEDGAMGATVDPTKLKLQL